MEQNHYFDARHPLHPYTHTLDANPGTVAPANALRGEKPKIKDGLWPCEKKGKWVQVEDHRGEEGYLNGKPFTVVDLGEYPDGWSKEPPEPTEEEVKRQKIKEMEGLLSEIDMQSVRPLRAILDDSATDFDKNKLKELENQAKILRNALSELS